MFMKILLFPFRLLWTIVTKLVEAIGILMGLLIGSLLMAVGILLCFTFIGAFIGVPMATIGFFILLRALY